jgi:hypothetical protein
MKNFMLSWQRLNSSCKMQYSIQGTAKILNLPQTNSLKTFTTNLRARLRDSANRILIPNNKALKGFLEEMGIHADNMQDLREDGQIAEAIGSTVERVVKVAHPLL